VDGDRAVAVPAEEVALATVQKRGRAPIDLRHLPHEEVNGDAEVNVPGQLLLGGAGTMLLILALPLKSVEGVEAVLVAMLLRLRGFVAPAALAPGYATQDVFGYAARPRATRGDPDDYSARAASGSVAGIWRVTSRSTAWIGNFAGNEGGDSRARYAIAAC
jgi:hypothetical protein